VRSPDSLVVVDAQGLDTDSPSLRLVDSVPMPDGPTQVTLVPRGEARSELVVISCAAAGVVAIYDPDVGQVVSQIAVSEVPREQVSQPFGIAVQQQGNAARLFVSNFGDGRVAVIDLPDLSSPQLARLVAHLGTRQDAQGSSTCQEVQQ
jgi:DNA-binding beta-propeller fold protein YncE